VPVHDVVVVGAGPVGLLLAGELARRGMDVVVLERRDALGAGTRAIGVHAPVLAALAPSGVTGRLLEHAVRVPRGEARADGHLLGTVRFDRLPAPFPFVATLPQSATEAVLADLAPRPRRGAEVTSVRPGTDVVRVGGADGAGPFSLTARLVVVAAGVSGRRLVSRGSAIDTHEYRDRYLMADVETGPRADADLAVVHLDRGGVLESFPLPGGARRFVAWDSSDAADADAESRVERLRAALRARGEDVAARAVSAATGFGVRRFVAPRLRNGRVFVIGDAAHEVSPIGGQGMNLGLLDAARLAPLLAAWLRAGAAPEAALHAWERRRIASARTAARLASVNTALGRPLPRALHAARSGVVRAMLSPATGGLFARAYAMGFDRDA